MRLKIKIKNKLEGNYFFLLEGLIEMKKKLRKKKKKKNEEIFLKKNNTQ